MPVVLRYIELLHAGLVCAAAALGWATGRLGPGSVVLGGALMSGNVWIFKRLFGFLVRRQPRPRLAIALLFAKLPALLALLWLVTRARVVAIDGVGVAVGVTCFPLAAVIVALAQHSALEG
jgi:hypothetical protein